MLRYHLPIYLASESSNQLVHIVELNYCNASSNFRQAMLVSRQSKDKHCTWMTNTSHVRNTVRLRRDGCGARTYIYRFTDHPLMNCVRLDRARKRVVLHSLRHVKQANEPKMSIMNWSQSVVNSRSNYTPNHWKLAKTVVSILSYLRKWQHVIWPSVTSKQHKAFWLVSVYIL